MIATDPVEITASTKKTCFSLIFDFKSHTKNFFFFFFFLLLKKVIS